MWFLCLLKTFQRLGYFVQLQQIPAKIVNHIAAHLGYATLPDLSNYDRYPTRVRHLARIRTYLNIRVFDEEGAAIVKAAIAEACQAKEDLADIINVAIEELVRHRYELPAFSKLRRLAYNGRARANNDIYQKITTNLTHQDRARLNRLFKVTKGHSQSPWRIIKADPPKLTLKNLRQHIEHVQWLERHSIGAYSLAQIADVKIEQFAAEAKTLNAPRMARLKAANRYTLAVALIAEQKATALDDLGEMLVKRINKIHNHAREALALQIEQSQDRTDKLVDTLHRILLAYRDAENRAERENAINEIVGENKKRLIKDCETHAMYAGKNYFPFLWRFHAPHRTTLFDVIGATPLVATTQENALIKAVEFIKLHRHRKGSLIDLTDGNLKADLPDMTWISERWQTAVFGQKIDHGRPEQVHRQYLELCIFYYLMIGLKSGDICIAGSDQFSDYSVQLVDWNEYHQQIGQYGAQVELPVEGIAFVNHTREWLQRIALTTDDAFPENEDIRIEQGRPIIRKVKTDSKVEGLERFEAAIAQRLKPVTILDVLNYTRQWIGWDKCFGPLSGFDAKLNNPGKHYIVTAFCYGCNMGPIQTARSIKDLSRYQIAWVNQRHVTEEKLNQAIVKTINTYDLFDLPKIWGSGKSASVDGTLWDVYEDNLFSEYHIRYGGYGGIGYYHVSDQYIALFSHFIPCGVYEAIYILDGLLKNESNIQPDTIHGDTHAQSETVFGLAYLLGIKLMPRIRNWKYLTFYKPDKKTIYKYIEGLFTDEINWELITNFFRICFESPYL